MGIAGYKSTAAVPLGRLQLLAVTRNEAYPRHLSFQDEQAITQLIRVPTAINFIANQSFQTSGSERSTIPANSAEPSGSTLSLKS